MESYLSDLLDRMNNASDQSMEAGYNSPETISWKAHREAEKIGDVAFIPSLISYLDKEKDKKRRDKAYFVLGHIAENTNDQAALDYLIYRVNKEPDKYVIASLLDRIAALNKPIGTDLEPLILATKSDKWLVRYSAIRSLNHSLEPIVETILVEILSASCDPYDIVYSNAVLSEIGTLKAIPYIEKYVNSRTRDVKSSAKYAIQEIRNRNR